LRVVNVITQINVVIFEYIKDWQYLTVVGHQSLSDHVSAEHQSLEGLEHHSDNVRLSGVEGSLDGNNQLRDDWQDLGSALLQQVVGSQNRQKSVGVDSLSQSVKKYRQVVVVVQFDWRNFPDNFVH